MIVGEIRKIFVVLGFAVLVIACDDTTPDLAAQNGEIRLIEATVRRLVILQSNIMRINGDNLISLTSAFGRLKNVEPEGNGRINEDSLSQVASDVCGDVLVRLDDNGLDKVEVNYKSGCEVQGRMLKGKVTYLYRRTESGIEFQVLYQNYSDQPLGKDLNPSVLNGYERGSYRRVEGGIFEEFNETQVDLTHPNGSFEQFRSEGEYHLSENTLTVVKYSFTMAGEGEEQYTGRVLNPMLLDYDCNDAFIPISGIEKFTHNEEEFFVDFGGDECDKAIAVTWNAETDVIQMGNEG